jgi:phage protein D
LSFATAPGAKPKAKGKQPKGKPAPKKPPVKGKQKPAKPPKPAPKAKEKPPAKGAKPPAGKGGKGAPGAVAKDKKGAKPPAKQPGGGGGGGNKGDTESSLHTPKYKIKIGKTPKELPAAVASRLVEIVVDQAVDMADMCTIVIRNDDFSISDNEDYKPGSKVDIELGYEEHGAKLTKCFQGEVTALKADFPRRGSMNVRIVGYTEYHRLMRGKHMRAWEQKSYSDIAKAIASECKLQAAVDPTQGQHEYVFQRNQTNLEFLLELAERVGYEVFCGEGKLFFRKPTPGGTKIRTLKKGELLLSFNPRTSISLLPTGVKVLSYDDGAVAQVSGEAKDSDAGPAMGGDDSGPKVSAKVGPAIQVVTEQVFRKAADAKALAVALMQKACLDFVQADATVQGSADIRPGFVVEVQGVGPIFSGPYYVTRVVHDFLPTGFSTRLGLRKTSISASKPAPAGPGQDGPDGPPVGPAGPSSGVIPGGGNGKRKKKIKDLKLAVGEQPPEWALGPDGLDDGPQIKNLKLAYGKQPPPGWKPLPPPPPPKPDLANLKFGYQPAPDVPPPPPKPDLKGLKLGYAAGPSIAPPVPRVHFPPHSAPVPKAPSQDEPGADEIQDLNLGYRGGA